MPGMHTLGKTIRETLVQKGKSKAELAALLECISTSVPQRAEPYSISRRNFRAFLILDCTTKYSITAPATPTARSRRPSPGA